MPRKCVLKYSVMHCAPGYQDVLVHLSWPVPSYNVHVYLRRFVSRVLDACKSNRFRRKRDTKNTMSTPPPPSGSPRSTPMTYAHVAAGATAVPPPPPMASPALPTIPPSPHAPASGATPTASAVGGASTSTPLTYGSTSISTADLMALLTTQQNNFQSQIDALAAQHSAQFTLPRPECDK